MNIFNLNSPTHLSLLLFGGVYKEKVKIPIVTIDGNFSYYKSGQNKGQIKTKIEVKEFKFRGLGLKPTGQMGKNGSYSTDEGNLTKICQIPLEKCKNQQQRDAINICKLILEARKLAKEDATYYTGIEKFIYPDSCIRASYQHTGTDTGRLSCSRPNLQNVPRKEE